MKRERTTRIEILNLLKKQGKMTAKQVGDALELTAMGARQHLMALERDGLVNSEFIRQKAGRPALYFKLSEKSEKFFPQEYANLLLSLLKNLEEIDGREKVGEVLTHRRKKMAEEYAELLAGTDLKEKVEIIAKLRDEGGYMAEAKDLGNELLLKEHNCPIHSIAKEFPEICHLELELFQELLGENVERLDHQLNGNSSCVYKISKSNGKKKSKN